MLRLLLFAWFTVTRSVVLGVVVWWCCGCTRSPNAEASGKTQLIVELIDASSSAGEGGRKCGAAAAFALHQLAQLSPGASADFVVMSTGDTNNPEPQLIVRAKFVDKLPRLATAEKRTASRIEFTTQLTKHCQTALVPKIGSPIREGLRQALELARSKLTAPGAPYRSAARVHVISDLREEGADDEMEQLIRAYSQGKTPKSVKATRATLGSEFELSVCGYAEFNAENTTREFTVDGVVRAWREVVGDKVAFDPYCDGDLSISGETAK